MSLQTLINRGLDTPVDFSFIKRVVGKSPTIRMVDHESGLGARPSLRDVFKGHQAVAILLHILQGKTNIGHWVCLLKAHPHRNAGKIVFFDSLGLGLYGLYKITHEEPKLLHSRGTNGKTVPSNSSGLETIFVSVVRLFLSVASSGS